MIIHWSGPCLASQSIDGWAGLQDVFEGLKIHTAWACVHVGDDHASFFVFCFFFESDK